MTPGREEPGRTYYTPEQYTRGIENQRGRTTPDGDRWPLLSEYSSPPRPWRRSRSFYPLGNGSAKAGHVRPARPAGGFSKVPGKPHAKNFPVVPARLAALAKTGRSYWIPWSYAPVLSEKCNAFSGLLKNNNKPVKG